VILCLDIGNSHIFGGLFEGDRLCLTFRMTSGSGASSDEFGLFFRAVLRENGYQPDAVQHIALCSVVPELVYSISASCQKYFAHPPFILKAGVKTGLKILYRNPLEVGADRIANAIAGTQMYPGEDLLIIDLGTATTVDVIAGGQEYLGGVIIPGLRMSMQALDQGTARLGSVEILRPDSCLGRATAESIAKANGVVSIIEMSHFGPSNIGMRANIGVYHLDFQAFPAGRDVTLEGNLGWGVWAQYIPDGDYLFTMEVVARYATALPGTEIVISMVALALDEDGDHCQ